METNELKVKDLSVSEFKETIKNAYLEAMYEYQQYRKKKGRNQDPDLISTSEAYRIRGRARVTRLIFHGLLKQTSSGVAKNSIKYVSKKKLLELDNVTL